MRVLALGGCGEMGSYTVKTLLNFGFCEKIIIADINEEKARSYAHAIGKPASWARVDVSDMDSLKNVMKDVDVVVNTIGPYYRFGVNVLNASIANGCHYLDINDDWEPTLDMLALDKQAKKAQVTAVIGLGASPGISNLLAVKALSELDIVEEIYTGWDLDSAKPEKIGPAPSAATVHGIHQLTGSIRTFQEGKFRDTKPIKEIKLTYPGIGMRSVWTIGHPEAVTLPRYFPSLRFSKNVMTSSRFNIYGTRLIAWLVNKGILSVEKAAYIAEKIQGPSDPQKTPDKMLQEMVDENNNRFPPLFALAKGKRNGVQASAGVMILSAPLGGMGGATGVPLAVGVLLLNRNKLRSNGVFAAEGIIDPDDFFNELAPLCTPQKKGASDLVLITRSWENDQVSSLLRQPNQQHRFF